ncbi:aldehyde dehydrogenase family protein [Sinirhodobacter populi]|uniref:Aldehyde dehydrogenase family protein n=1 Tax=Paenirhodobacter populi TaxID=2306993 RepID=A0A443ITA9_9RHOB|nr:aldehyde dehydrogenase family protein [Sinirhodobacter populi]
MTEASVPPGDVNVVTSSATSEVVDTMLDDPRVCELSFTGMTSVTGSRCARPPIRSSTAAWSLPRLFSCADGAGGRAARRRVAREEIFGPVAPVHVFDRGRGYRPCERYRIWARGLCLYHHFGRGLRVAERLQAEMLALNRGLVPDPAGPFGAVRRSGLGREGAPSRKPRVHGGQVYRNCLAMLWSLHVPVEMISRLRGWFWVRRAGSGADRPKHIRRLQDFSWAKAPDLQE